MTVRAIAACSVNRVIGRGGPRGGIPWDLPRDREHFRRHTRGQHLLLGRRTFGEMEGWFRPGHTVHVISRTPGFSHPEAHTVSPTTEAALAAARASGAGTLLVCGGASTYRAALPHTSEILLTVVGAAFGGTATFPELPPSEWHLSSSQHHPADSENAYPLEFRTYRRI